MKTSGTDLVTMGYEEVFSETLRRECENFALVAATLCNCSSSTITIVKAGETIEEISYGVANVKKITQTSLFNKILENNEVVIIQNLKERAYSSQNLEFKFYAGYPLLSPEGDCLGVLSLFDVESKELTSDQKKSLQILADQIVNSIESNTSKKNKENFYEHIVDDLNIGTWFIDLVDSKFNLDKRAAKIFGYEEDYFKDFDFREYPNIMYEHDVLESKDIINNIINKKLVKYHHKVRLKHKKGSWVWVFVKGEVTKWDADGNPILISGSFVNINKQKIKELHLDSVLNNVDCLAIRHKLNLDGSQEVIDISRGVHKLLGLTKEDVYKDFNTIFKLIHEDDADYVKNSLEESARTLKEWNIQWRIYHVNGTLKWHKGHGVPTKNKDGSITWDTAIVNITESKLKKLELKKLNKELSNAQKIAKLGYWYWDMKELSFTCSDVVYDIYGLDKSREKLFADDILVFFTKEDIKQNIKDRDIAIKLDQEFKTENKIKTHKGEVKWVRQVGNFKKDINGEVDSYEGTLQDITESKLIEIALEDSIKRYTYVTQATSDAIWDLDFVNGKIFWGDNYLKLFGHSFIDDAKADFEYWESQIHPDDHKRVVESFKACLANGDLKWKSEYRFKNINGKYFDVVDRAFVVRDETGNPVRMVGALQDVTDKVAAFEEIRRSNERFEKVADATNEAIWDWDLIDDVLYQGPGYFKLFGNILKKPFSDFKNWAKYVHPDDIEDIINICDRVIKDKSVYYFANDYRFLKSNGTYANVVDRARIIRDDDGKAIRMVGAMQDVTSIKEYENSLKNMNLNLENQALELKRYNEELEQFAYVVSHDLQEPLRMISSFLILLEKKYDPIIDETGKKYIHFAVDGAKRMRQIILDLLDFSRVGRSDEELEIIDLNDIIKDVETVFKPEIEAKNAEINVSDMPKINNYKTPLDQLFQNLIGNALKYQKQGEKPVINIFCEEQDMHYKFTVEDNGIGIDSEYFDRIFVIFQRLHGRDEFKGTGIGLALVKKIIDNLQGKIWVESKVDLGTKFIFTIKKR